MTVRVKVKIKVLLQNQLSWEGPILWHFTASTGEAKAKILPNPAKTLGLAEDLWQILFPKKYFISPGSGLYRHFYVVNIK
jgi:hypothetical protein